MLREEGSGGEGGQDGESARWKSDSGGLPGSPGKRLDVLHLTVRLFLFILSSFVSLPPVPQSKLLIPSTSLHPPVPCDSALGRPFAPRHFLLTHRGGWFWQIREDLSQASVGLIPPQFGKEEVTCR